MSIQTKNNFKRSSRLVGILLFAFLFFFNIKIMLSDESSGIADLSLFGVKINLFETAFAESGGGGDNHGKWQWYYSYQMCRCEPLQMGETWECTGLWSWSTSC